MTVLRPSLSAAARAVVVEECALVPHFEHAFRCEYDAATRTLVSARLTCRGTRDRVSVFASDLAAGLVHLHTHPSGQLELSDADHGVLDMLAPSGVGFAITDNAASGLLLAREPLLPFQFTQKPTRRSRSWVFLDRIMVSYLAPLKEAR